MNLSNIKSQLLKLSRNCPQLSYDPTLAAYLSNSDYNTKELLDIYFENQPSDYISELSDFSAINENNSREEKIFCFVCCYNETPNISNLIANYAKQSVSVNFEVCFIVNFAENELTFQNDYDNLINTIDILIEYKKKYNWINIIAKQFKKNHSGLGRARKYGLDYCLFRLSKLSNNQIDQSIIISNEGDTLFIKENYFSDFYFESNANKNCIIQGMIDYPRFIKDNSNLVFDYITFKDKIHLGLGLNFKDIPAFGGIMPIGRNFCIQPGIAVRIASIDPKYHVGTDDDINMGLDITYRLGIQCKIYRPIPLITNPRREVILIYETLQGKWESGKEMYECFHNVKYIYDYSIENIKSINDRINNQHNLKDIHSVIHDLFIWVFRNVAKSELISERFITHEIKKHSIHEINYWQMENEIMDFILKYLDKNHTLKAKIFQKSFSIFSDLTDHKVDKGLLSIDVNYNKVAHHI